MGKLEERVYSNFFNNAVLRVTRDSARFYYYGSDFQTKETYPIQEIDLENFTYLLSFLEKENQYMEMSYDGDKRLFSAVLCCSRMKNSDKNFSARESLYKESGLNFISIFETLEECLMKEKYKNFSKKIEKRLQVGGCFQICGSPQINGVYIYEDAQVKCIPEKEFSTEDYLKEKEFEVLYNSVLSGKIAEIRYEENQFVLELFYLCRTAHQGPFTKVLEERVEGKKVSICLEKMEKILNNNMTLIRSISKDA